jgi:voltage-gated potassium channel
MSETRALGDTRHRSEALDRFEQLTAVPMLVLALAIIPLLLIPFMVDLSPAQRALFEAIDWFIWALFVVEYVVRLVLSPKRWWFVRHNVIDLLFVALPFLRPLRIARSARALRVLRAGRGMVILLRALKAGREVFTQHKLNYMLLIGLLFVMVGALVVVQAEQNVPDSNITSYPDALWWAVTTITTVGYGDRFPVTGMGRAVAVVLMLFGIGLFGLLAASMASYFLGEKQEGTEDKLDEISERLNRIEEALRNPDQRSSLPGAPGHVHTGPKTPPTPAQQEHDQDLGPALSARAPAMPPPDRAPGR